MAKKTTWNDARIKLLKRAADLANEHRSGRKLNWIYAAAVLDSEGNLDKIGRTPEGIKKAWAVYRKPLAENLCSVSGCMNERGGDTPRCKKHLRMHAERAKATKQKQLRIGGKEL